MTTSQNHLKLALIALIAIILAACGGGGGGSDPVVNTAPAFSDSSVSIEVAENTTGVIYTAEATDAEGNTITYSLSGADQAQFSIGTSNGELQFTSSPAYDDPQDSNKDNVYEIQISASDSSASSSIAVMVTVTEAGTGGGTNQAPSVSVSGSQQVNEGTDIALSGSASDSDGSIESYQWRQLGGTTAQLGDADSAELEFGAPMVELSNDLVFELEVTDNDGATASAQITVKVNNINQQPQISASALSVDAGATKGLSIEATDPDTNDVLLYSLQQQPTAGSVSLNSTSGYLEYSAPDDGSNSDSFIVQVSDGALSSTATVQVTITQPVTNSADVEAPSAAKIVSASSLEVGVMEIFWFASSDADTADAELRYDIHVGTAADFTPDASNRLATVQEVLNARVSGLPDATDLYALIVTRDSGDNSAQSSSFAFQQASSTELVVLNDDADFATDSELRLQTAEVNDTALVLTANDQSSLPEPGQILISEEGSGYLRKVSAVEQSEGTITVATESAALAEVVDAGQINDSTKLFRDVQSSYVDGSSFQQQNVYNLSASNSVVKQERQVWAQGAFVAITEEPLDGKATTVNEGASWFYQLFMPADVTKSNSDITVTLATVDEGTPLVMEVGSTATVEFAIAITDNAREDQYEIRSYYVYSDADDSVLSTTTASSSGLNEVIEDGNLVELSSHIELRAKQSHDEEITISLSINYGDYDCSGVTDICDPDNLIVLEFSVLLIDKAPAFSGDEPIDLDFQLPAAEATASISGEVNFAFEPDMEVLFTIDGLRLQDAEVVLSGALDYSYNPIITVSGAYSNQDDPMVIPLNVFGNSNKRSYIRTLLLGYVPVVMKLDIEFNAEAWIDVTGSISLEQLLEFNASSSMGVTYDRDRSDRWQGIAERSADGMYTLDLIAETGVIGQIRLIPDVTVSFYDAGSGNLSLEPYVQGELALSTDMEAQISQAREEQQSLQDIESFYSLQELALTAGLECKVYASLDILDFNVVRYPESGKATICDPSFNIFTLPSAQILLDATEATYQSDGSVSAIAELSAIVHKGDGLVSNRARTADIAWSTFPTSGVNISSAFPYTDWQDYSVNSSSSITFTTSSVYTAKLFFGGEYTPRPWGQQIVEYELDLRDLFTACYEDCDSDGMPSDWEVANGLDPNVDDAAGDPDGDGYDNLTEYENGSDPFSADAPENQAPVANISVTPDPTSTTLTTATEVTLNGSASSDPDGDALDYTWSQPSSQSIDLSATNTSSTKFTATNPGTYTFTLSVSDGELSDSSTVIMAIAQANRAPTASISVSPDPDSTTLTTATEITLNGSDSSDPDGDTLDYTWSQASNQSIDLSSTSTATTTFTAANPGTYTFTLTVDDGSLTDSAEVTLEIIQADSTNRAPTAIISVSPDPDSTTLTTATEITLNGSASSDPDGDALDYTWSQPSAQSIDLSATNTAITTFTATDPGTYTFTLSISDGELGDNSEAIVTIHPITLPTDFTATAGDAQVTLTWSPADDTTYTIYRSSDSACEPTVANISTNCTAGAEFAEKSTGFVDTGLSNDTTYYYWLEATRNGASLLSTDPISATPEQSTTSITPTGALNDTGIDWGGNYESGNNTNCTSSNISAPQDCHQGRDAESATNDDSDGHAGFSFTKLDSSGNALTASATNWSCVQDNVTGLIWEVKTDDDDLHDKHDKYKWYNTDPATNGGEDGYADGNICYGYDSSDASTYCNTQAFTARVNEAGLCGAHDWRLPSKEELRSIVDYSRYNPSIDTDYFPNARSSGFWSSSPYAGASHYAWYVYFYLGNDYDGYRADSRDVRLVRSRP